MTAFVIRRLASMLLVLFAVSVITFLIFFATPGVNPARRLAGRNATPQTLRLVRHEYGLDRPLPVQYVQMINHLFVRRDLVSYAQSGVPIVPLIVHGMPVTLSLVCGTAVVWLALSVTLGVAAARSRGTPLDPLLMLIGLVGMSMPVFWLGEMANLLVQDRLHHLFLFSWLPPVGYVSPTSNPVQWVLHLIVPCLVLSVTYVGFYARVLRSSLIEAEGEDFIRTARAKGLSQRRILVRHALRTSMITFVSLFGLDFGALLGGAILVEVVFGLPGVGLLADNAITTLDLPVIMATVIYGAFFIVATNAVVELLYGWLEPRVRAA